MKKRHVLQLVVTSLLVTSPILISPVVQATTVQTTDSETTTSELFTYQGAKLTNNSIIPISQSLPANVKDKANDLLRNAKNLVSVENGAIITTSVEDIIRQLQSQYVVWNGYGDDAAIFKLPSNGFYISLTAKNSNGAISKVLVPFGKAALANEPQFSLKYHQNSKEVTTSPDGQIFQVTVGSKFDPTKILGSNGTTFNISATSSDSNENPAKIVVEENKVQTNKPGSFSTVKLSAINNNGKKYSISYVVLVTPTKGAHELNVTPNPNAVGYNIVNDTQYPEVGTYIRQGTPIYISNITRIVFGISYTKISLTSQKDADDAANINGGLWIKTKDLANPMSKPETVTKKVMHESLVYDNSGSSKVRKIAAFSNIVVDKQTVNINGKQYYKLENAPDYIKASNIDGTKRILKHNAYIYATSTRRANKTLLNKGSSVITYGGSYKFKNNKRYYRIEGATKNKKMYVKVANFK